MMLSLFLVCLIPYIHAAALPKPCCGGHQFSATLHQVTGSYNFQTKVPLTYETTIKLTYDYDGKMTKTEIPGATIINDYNKNKTYQIAANKCQVETLTRELQATCIPPTATFRGRYYIGDDINYEVNVWHIVDSALGNITVSVMPQDCVPVMQGISNADNNTISQTTMYFHDVVYGAPAVSTFTVPATCSGK